MSRTVRERIARFLDPASYFALDYLPSDFATIANRMRQDEQAASRAQVQQLKFLLSQCPIIDAPTNAQQIGACRSRFAYVHPKTMARLPGLSTKSDLRRPLGHFTNWVATSLMPEDRVVYSPNPLPGLEKNLAGA